MDALWFTLFAPVQVARITWAAFTRRTLYLNTQFKKIIDAASFFLALFFAPLSLPLPYPLHLLGVAQMVAMKPVVQRRITGANKSLRPSARMQNHHHCTQHTMVGGRWGRGAWWLYSVWAAWLRVCVCLCAHTLLTLLSPGEQYTFE